MITVGKKVTPAKQLASVAALAAIFVSAFALSASAVQDPPRESANRMRVEQNTRLHDLISGPTRTLQAAVAGDVEPTAEILLTPMANHPSGEYGHGGFYSDADINGQRLTVLSGGGRTFWNMQIRNWGPALLLSWQGQIDASGFLGASADCGSGPGSCVDAGDLLPANQTCGDTGDCVDSFVEGVSFCTDGVCSPAWVNIRRPDFRFDPDCHSRHVGCSLPDSVAPLICFATTGDPFCATDDRGETLYVATLALDIPPDAKGIYTIGWVAEETFMLDDSDPAQEIPLAAMIPGELEIPIGRCCFNFDAGPSCATLVTAHECDLLHTEEGFPVWEEVDDPCPADGGTPCDGCDTDEDCDDADLCTRGVCTSVPGRVFAQCTFLPRLGWVPDSQCCDAATGQTEQIVVPNVCTTAACEFEGNRGLLVITPLPVGTPCTEVGVDEPCGFEPVCRSDETCAETPINDADIPCDTDGDCRAETGVEFSRCVDDFCACSLDDQIGACCSASDARGCVDDRIEPQCDCFGCVWTVGETCRTINCSSLVETVPAVSTWAVAMLALTLLSGLAIKFSHRATE